ncbi:MAG: phosphohistidine phosphatase SixA [Verrucomicrobia bacterium]|nr:phosphohistidine phosphatase SixA [Verrucomicrobiota bacterium]
MELYVLRHGIAQPREALCSMKDSDRALTKEGAQKMRRIAKGMKALGLSFDAILTSPFRRAKQTANIVAETLRLKKRMEIVAALAAGERTKSLIEALENFPKNVERILIVGHEPDLSCLVSRLVTGGPNLAVNFKKGALCKLTLNSIRHGRCAILEWLLAPGQLARIR